MKQFIYIINFVAWVLVGALGTCYYTSVNKIKHLQETIDRQASAISTLEKQQNNVEVPRYLDSIPDYE